MCLCVFAQLSHCMFAYKCYNLITEVMLFLTSAHRGHCHRSNALQPHFVLHSFSFLFRFAHSVRTHFHVAHSFDHLRIRLSISHFNVPSLTLYRQFRSCLHIGAATTTKSTSISVIFTMCSHVAISKFRFHEPTNKKWAKVRQNYPHRLRSAQPAPAFGPLKLRTNKHRACSKQEHYNRYNSA